MSSEVVGYSPANVVNAVKEKAPPTMVVPEAEWNAWAGEAGWHEWLHTRPSKNHTETMNVVWEYGVITSTLAIKMPDFINETYMTMKSLYFEVAVGAFVQPKGGFDQLPAQVIKETAEIVGSEMSGPDWNTWRWARNQVIREEWEQSIEENIEQQKEVSANQSGSREPESKQEESEEEAEKKQDFNPGSSGVIKPPPSSTQETYQSLPLAA
ncbi:hypothetical protein IH980_04395 [Patescibacteria group bacterium]|nr:hypothetical protein [Patescibacteria group bacterium]